MLVTVVMAVSFTTSLVIVTIMTVIPMRPPGGRPRFTGDRTCRNSEWSPTLVLPTVLMC